MALDPRAHNRDAAQALEKARGFAAGESREDYLNDEMLRAAIERKLQNAGEALAQLREVEPAMAARVPEHDRIIAFPYVLVHRYEAIDDNRIWNVPSTEVPTALAALQEALGEQGDGAPLP
jgi:uncharacterized protein with HEPN domain